MARRLLLIQIDGLAGTRLARAIADGTTPAIAAFCGARSVRRRVVAVPPSTPVFQSALLYGAAHVVHGYAWFDREAGLIRRFDVPEDIAAVEGELRRLARSPPLLAVADAASYFIIFIGGAARALLNLARGLLPTRWKRTGGLIAGLALALLRAPIELVRAAGDLVRFAARARTLAFELNWLAMRVLHVFFEEVSTAGALADLRAGTPAVFLNFVAYDEASHRRGPDGLMPRAQLRRIDRRVGRLLRGARRYGYDVAIFSDHGQVAAIPFHRVEGRSLPVRVFEACAAQAGQVDDRFRRLADRLDRARVRASRVRKWPGVLRQGLEQLARAKARRAAVGLERGYGFPAGAIAVATGGSIAHVYVGREPAGATLEEIERRFPRLVPALVASPGIGLVVARTGRRGAVALCGDRRVPLGDGAGLASLEPFARVGVELAVRLVTGVVAMPTAGDLVVYGAFAPAGAVTFEAELGSHGGIHPEELDVFLVESDGLPVPAGEPLDPAALHVFLRGSLIADPLG